MAVAGADAPRRDIKSRDAIKLAALELFALRGIAAVSTRELAQVCGLRNAGSVNYHFGSKQDLVTELIKDASKLIESDRNERLDHIEATGDPISVRQIIDILADTSAVEPKREETRGYAMRLLSILYLQDRSLLFTALGEGTDRGTRRCLAHLSRMIDHVPADVMKLRLMLAVNYLFSVSSTREAAIETPSIWHALWGKQFAYNNLLDTVEGMLTCAISIETMDDLQQWPDQP